MAMTKPAKTKTRFTESQKRVIDLLQREYPEHYSASGVASALALHPSTARRALAVLVKDPLLIVRRIPNSYRAVNIAPHLRRDDSDGFRAEVYGIYK